MEVGVPAVDDRVTRLEVFEQFVDLRLGGVAGRDHHPDGSGLLERCHEVGDRKGRLGALAFGLDLLRLLRRAVVDHDLVPVADESTDHVGAHPAETDEADTHRGHASRG